MKNLKINIFIAVFLAIGCNSCTNELNVEPASEYSSSFLNSKEGVEALRNSAYKNILLIDNDGANRIYTDEAPTDVFENFRGLLNGRLQPIQDFSWTPSEPFFQNFWRRNYRAIRDANILLKAIPDQDDIPENKKKLYIAEAHFIRGLAYRFLYGWFGPVPIVESDQEDLFPKRASDEEMKAYVENELVEASENLPASTDDYGRATKGAALGVLDQFYINTRQWQKAVATANDVINLGKYGLVPDYTSVFALNNEKNKEMVYAFPAVAINGYGNIWVSNALPPGYPTPIFNTATQVTLPVEFYNTFEDGDTRKKVILTEYTNKNGDHVSLLSGDEIYNPRSLKYPLDPNADQRYGGEDIPLVRYADILLIKAEGLVMSSGNVSEEALGLLNEIRERAGLEDYTLSDAPDKDSFIDLLLKERSWEFFSEGKRREDLLRHDKFIENAKERGKAAQDYRVLFPIPQSEIDANPNLVQNKGY